MNIRHILRLILNSWFIIGAFGLIVAFSVYWFTRGKPKIYESTTLIYTGLATGYSIESTSSNRFDYFATNTKFDNFINIIRSRETFKEVALRLLAQHYYDDSMKITEYRHLDPIFPYWIRKSLVDTASVEKTYLKLAAYANKNDTNVIYKILNSDDIFYGLKKISSLMVRRMQSSDLIEIKFQTIHAGICKQTLEKVVEVMFRKYNFLQTSETGTVLEYFNNQVELAAGKLNNAEQKLLKFQENNRIINYYEQTRFIAEQKEQLDNKYNEELMDLSSSQAALKSIEEKLNAKNTVALQGDNILAKRKMLSDVSSKIAMFEIYNPGETEQISRLKQTAEKLKNELSEEITNITQAGRTTEGLASKLLLEEWLTTAVAYEESKAKVEILKKQKGEFLEKYDKFSPLGSELNKIEREISIAEKEYLSFVDHLNTSKLRQQNLEVTPTITVLDPPNLPLQPNKSYRKLLILAGFVVGSFFIMAMLVFVDFFDQRIRSPLHVEKITGLPLAGAFPNTTSRKYKAVDSKYLETRLPEMLFQNIETEIIKDLNSKAQIILVYSIRKGEGKTSIGQILSSQLNVNAHPALFVRVEADLGNSQQVFGSIRVPVKEYVKNTFSIEQVIADNSLNVSDYRFIVLELPAILNYNFPANIAKQAVISVLVCNANRVWTKVDENLISTFRKYNGNPIVVALNGVESEYLEDIMGEIPKSKNYLYRFLNRLF
jgi:uncharacterized protein involved in exopolysaccharide biosynthesis